jgi:hypothetical protein
MLFYIPGTSCIRFLAKRKSGNVLELKIINMAEKLKDELDLSLESLFGSEPIHDDGFSVRIVSRVRRQMWVRRLSMPIALLAGAIIGAKPLMGLVGFVPKLLGSVPVERFVADNLPTIDAPQISTLIMGIALLGMVMIVGRMLEET